MAVIVRMLFTSVVSEPLTNNAKGTVEVYQDLEELLARYKFGGV